MPTVRFKEVRTLLIPLEAAVDAVLELDRCHGGQLARAKVMEARVETAEEPCLLLVVRHATAGAPRIEQKRYALPVVAAALIHYCSRMEVPLPRRAGKSIEIVPEGFEFKLTSLTELEMLHGEVKCSNVVGQSRFSRANPNRTQEQGRADARVDRDIEVDLESELSEAAASLR